MHLVVYDLKGVISQYEILLFLVPSLLPSLLLPLH
jgi:hypothetical protein